MHGQFVRVKKGMNEDKSWQWIAKEDLKGYTEALIYGAQEQALIAKFQNCYVWSPDYSIWKISSKGIDEWHDVFTGNFTTRAAWTK